MKNKVVLVTVAIVLMGLAFFFGSKMFTEKKAEKMQGIPNEKLAPAYAMSLGTSTPVVTLVEFFDPECESCKEFYPLVKMIMQDYEGKIRLVLRYAPFHQNSLTVVKVLEAARLQGRYWEALEVLYQSQSEWGSHHNPQPELIWKYLPNAGVNLEKIRLDMNDPAIQEIIEKDLAAVQEFGVTKTPTFFINGKPLKVFGYEQLRIQIEEALNEG